VLKIFLDLKLLNLNRVSVQGSCKNNIKVMNNKWLISWIGVYLIWFEDSAGILRLPLNNLID